ITGAHGVTGEVRLKLFGDGVAALGQHSVFNNGGLTLESLRDDRKGGAIARFAEVAGRNAADAMRGPALTVPPSALPPPVEGEYYHADLLGLAAVSDAGDELGRVIAVDNYGAGDIVEIERPDGKKFMVPMTEAAVPEWDGERLVISRDFVQ